MQRIDYVIGAALVLAVVGTILGVATYEEPASGLLEFEIVWSIDRFTSEASPVDRTGAGTASAGIPIDVDNVARVTFEVRATGFGPRAAAEPVSVTVTDPDGVVRGEDSGTLPVGAGEETVVFLLDVDVTPVPSIDRLEANSTAEAREQFFGRFNSTQGRGDWTVRVGFASNGLDALDREPRRLEAKADVAVFQGVLAPSVGPGT